MGGFLFFNLFHREREREGEIEEKEDEAFPFSVFLFLLIPFSKFLCHKPIGTYIRHACLCGSGSGKYYCIFAIGKKEKGKSTNATVYP